MNGRRRARGSQPAEHQQLPVTSRALAPQIAAIRPSIRVTHTQVSSAGARRSLVVLIPLYYNPDPIGRKKPMESHKIKQTEIEIRQRFSGYGKSRTEGWYRHDETGEEFIDELIRFQIDAVYDAATMGFLKGWKTILERRFEQEAIYMTLSGPLVLL